MADVMRNWLTARFHSRKSESPIEALFYAAYTMAFPHLMLPPEPVLRMEQQAEIGKYRADFLFSVAVDGGSERKLLVVEIDGHDFHERTKEQAARDKTRDRWMTGAGYDVMRFTGSEVWANPFGAVQEVSDRLCVLRHGMTLRESRARAGLAALRQIIEGDGNA